MAGDAISSEGMSMQEVAEEQVKRQAELEEADENYINPAAVSEPDGKTKAEQTDDKSKKK